MSKQQTLDADPKARKQINFTGNSNWGRNADFEIINANTTMFFIIEEAKENANTTVYYWRSQRNCFRLFFANCCESIVILFCCNIMSIWKDWI